MTLGTPPDEPPNLSVFVIALRYVDVNSNTIARNFRVQLNQLKASAPNVGDVALRPPVVLKFQVRKLLLIQSRTRADIETWQITSTLHSSTPGIAVPDDIVCTGPSSNSFQIAPHIHSGREAYQSAILGSERTVSFSQDGAGLPSGCSHVLDRHQGQSGIQNDIGLRGTQITWRLRSSGNVSQAKTKPLSNKLPSDFGGDDRI